MSIVLDANLVTALVLALPYSDQADAKIADWKHKGQMLLAPALLEYEVTTVLRRAVVAGWIDSESALEALSQISALGVECVLANHVLQASALRWAERLGQNKAYGAHYLALAEQQRAEFWTADRRLANGSQAAGATWVYWIGKT
ncbi:MAG: type II toxin-antitoxin system VapC family toxin [Aphanocapsa lilacina HA4352-LM1]|nr:type II toxin-antitoxin system VapC family toxin [Aphanocapsa lilacina HA4352-LM1]